MIEWKKTADCLPENGLIVETKIDTGGDVRNETRLYRQDRLWFTPDGTMYVYYTPTHWRECEIL